MKPVVLLCLLTALPLSYAGASGVIISLNAGSAREIANDEFQAQFYTQQQAATPAALASGLNQTLNRAQTLARRFSAVETRSAGYHSWPEYDKGGKIRGWSGRASLTVKSRDLPQASELTAQLQSFMLLDNAGFQLSAASRQAAQRELIPEAIAQLQDQAAVAARALGKNTVKVRELNLSTPPEPMMMRSMAFKAALPEGASAAPDSINWQPGQSRLQVEISGKAELE